MADTKDESIDPSPGTELTEEKPAPAADITLETLPVFPVQGSAVSSARLTPTELERPRSDPSRWNGNGAARPEVVEGNVHDATAPVSVTVPRRQGLPSFAQSEFYTVYNKFLSIHPFVLACSRSVLFYLLLHFLSFSLF
jgi:hypothetical protein